MAEADTAMTNFYRNTAWYVCQGIHLSCIVIGLYLLYAMFHYRAIKVERQKDICGNYITVAA